MAPIASRRQRGSDLDQAQLFASLLSAAGYSSSQVVYRYGYLLLFGPQLSSWLGVANDLVAIANVLANGGIPLQEVVDQSGQLVALNVAHVWIDVTIDGTVYEFDPSYKSHTITAGLANLDSIIGYDKNQFLSDAGGSIDTVSIWNIDRQHLRADLAGYANNLIGYIKSNNSAWTMGDVVGGKSIQPLSGSPLRNTTVPNFSPFQPTGFPQNWGAVVPDAYRTCFTISMPGVSPSQCGAVSNQTIQLFSDETYGHRITVSSIVSGSNYVPTLLIDGSPPSNGQNTGTPAAPGSAWDIAICVLHPYASTSENICKTNPVTDAGHLSIKAGGAYLIGAGWGEVGRGMIEKHRALLQQAQVSGASSSSEEVLGESLAVISYTWLAECASAIRLNENLAKATTQYHHGIGITAQAQIQSTTFQGPYVDLPFNYLSLQSQTSSVSTFPPSVVADFYAVSGLSSSLESAVLEQTQALTAGIQAASTVRLVDMNASTAAKTFFADGTSSAGVATYFSSIRPTLTTTYGSSDLNFIDCAISTTCSSSGSPAGSQLLLPANGNIGVSQWHGAGYTITSSTSNSISVTQKISGGLSGGFSGEDIDDDDFVESTGQQMFPPPSVPDISSAAFANDPAPVQSSLPQVVSNFISDPVDTATGAYVYKRTDLSVGSGQFPYALSFGRTYVSASNMEDIGLGNGWSHTFSLSVSRDSNPFAGFGESSPISAASAIVAAYVSQDLLSGTLSAQSMSLSWIIARWSTDQLTNNAAVISRAGTIEEFIVLPHPDGSPSAGYNPPLGSAVVLTGSAPDSYGNYTSFSYRNKDQSVLTFNAIGSGPDGQIAGWTLPNGVSLSFTYGYSFNGKSYLTYLANNLGRSLTLEYTGAHLAKVMDDTSRAVTYSYDGSNNLVGEADPLQNTTSFAYDNASRLVQIFYPGNSGIPYVTNAYDALGRINRQANANGNWSDFYLAGSRTEFIDAAGDRHITYQTPRGKIIKDAFVLSNSFGNVFNDTSQQNGVVNVTINTYDGQDRLTQTTAPEGRGTAYAYDGMSNIVSATATPKPGSPLSPQIVSYSYDASFNKPTQIVDPLGLVTMLGYDGITGNLTSKVADAGPSPHFNARSGFAYNNVGQVVSMTDPLGTVTQFGYDSSGNNITVVRDAGAGHLNQLTTFGYDALGDVVSITDPNGNISTNLFDAARQRIRAVQPNGLVTAFSYDPNGQVIQTKQISAGTVLRTTGTTYTLTGKVASVTDANGNVTTSSYDPVDRLANVTDAMGRITRFGYDAMSRQVSLSSPAIQASPLQQRSYTPDGLLASLADANNHTTSFAYDGLDRRGTITYPLGSTEGRTYDADNNILTRTTRAGDTVTFTYDTLNRRTGKAAPSEPTVTYAYDLAGHLTGVGDNSAPVVAAAPPGGSPVQYATTSAYDIVNRPVNTVWTPAPTFTAPSASSVSFVHSYNKANQRIGQTATDNSWLNYPASSPSTVSYTANALNQYTAVGTVSPTYDGNGNLTSDGTLTLGYDADSRLTAASATGLTASYAYDGQGRRKSKTVNGTTTVFVTDANNREVMEYDGGSGAILRWYAYGLGANDVVNRTDVALGTRTAYIPDIQGSIFATLDSTSTTLTAAAYLPFGANANAPAAFAYTGQRIDPESGLYYYRARHYSPLLGRFLQPDPIRYRGGINLYAYVGNDPLNATDPNGLVADAIGEAASSAANYAYQNPLQALGIAAVVGATIFAPENAAALPEEIAGIEGTAIAAEEAGLSGTALARSLGQVGEDAVGITGPKVGIEIPGSGQIRIPDALTESTLTEVKNVNSLSYTQQLRDFTMYSQANGLDFQLYVRPSTQLSGPLQQAITNGRINLNFIPGTP